MTRFTFAAIAWLVASSLAAPVVETRAPPSLRELSLQTVLTDASPVFGNYVSSEDKNANWMKAYPDGTLLVHMNLPGTHDAATWNYSLATQKALQGITDLGGNPEIPPEVFRCQDQSLVMMLNAGIRVFDLRFAFDITNSTLVFYHGPALQSQTATVEDVLFGFYGWLDEHPSEALLLSFNYEGSTTIYARNNAAVQLAIFNTLTSAAAKKYFVQTQDKFGTLGEARGKITLLRRFSLDKLPASYSDAIPGVHFEGSRWADNGLDISLVYNTEQNLVAYIEDFYEITVPTGTPAADAIDKKLNATTTHLLKATTEYPDSLFWTFASGQGNLNVPNETPQIIAIGNGTESTPLGGVNQQLVPFLRELKGKRVGIIMFDFFGTPGGLIETVLSLQV